MTAQEMIDKVETMHRREAGYHYSTDKITEVVTGGYDAIPDGACVGRGGDQRIHKIGDVVECRKDGIVIKSTTITTDAQREQIVCGYAYLVSRLGSCMGCV